MRLLPGDPIRMLVTAQTMSIMTEDDIQFLRHLPGADAARFKVDFPDELSGMGGIVHSHQW